MESSNNILAAILTIVGGLGVATITAKKDAKLVAKNEKLKNQVTLWRVLAVLGSVSSLVGWYL
jgi:O-antigen/teichoic acid export membrane protein